MSHPGTATGARRREALENPAQSTLYNSDTNHANSCARFPGCHMGPIVVVSTLLRRADIL